MAVATKARIDTGLTKRSSDVSELRLLLEESRREKAELLEESRREKTELQAVITQLQVELGLMRQQLAESSERVERAAQEAREDARRREDALREEAEKRTKALCEEAQRDRELISLLMGNSSKPSHSRGNQQQQQQQQRKQHRQPSRQSLTVRQSQELQPSLRQLQRQHQESELIEEASSSAGTLEDSFAEVVQRKSRRWQELRTERRKQQQHQQEQPRAGLQTTDAAGQQHQRCENLQRRSARKRPDEIFVAPGTGQTYQTLYEKVRLNPNLAEENRQIRRGHRTARDHLRLKLERNADAVALMKKIQEELGEMGTARVVTEMAEIIITNIDMLATEEDIRKTFQTVLEKEATLATINIWERRDGSQRARVRLPRSDANHLIDKRLLIGYSCCMGLPGDRQIRHVPALWSD
uniref:trichohyalin-like n=1 Tax=Anopheles coluzzii TaxID=1518534 RepID=UPI0020FFA8D5|nr:trichohyalin-like [Anopheles coluzzii]